MSCRRLQAAPLLADGWLKAAAGCAGFLLLLGGARAGSSLRLTGLDRSGWLAWTNAPVPGVCAVESAPTPVGPWSPVANSFATNSAGGLGVSLEDNSGFYRVRALDVSPTPQGFTNLIRAYGLLETIAGTGEGKTDGVSYWQPWFEGQPAVWASLSRPHFAMADRAGNVYIADKNSHAVLRVTPEGEVFTHAGTHEGGFNGEGPEYATALQLNAPNSLWVRADGTVYILDTGNGRVRRVNPGGAMQTLFVATADGGALGGGRALWVRDDESLAYFGNETRIRCWTPAGGLTTFASGFVELGGFFVEGEGNLIVCDRGAHYVYRVLPGGSRTVLAGNGTSVGGGDGAPARSTGLYGVRSVWPVPTGGYLLLTHDGCQLWYLDAAGTIHLLLHGAGGRTHDGDGTYFYQPDQPRISEGRSVTMDWAGNILICESDYGYIRRIRFLPLQAN